LWGDSLTNQIYSSQKLERRTRSHNSGILYTIVQHREPYIVPSAMPFPGNRSPVCCKQVNANPKKFYLQSFPSEEAWLELVFQNTSYDYVIFNEFAHFGHHTTSLWENCYKDSNLTFSDMMKDAMDYYQQQMERIGWLLQQFFPATKAYYRTSSPPVYPWRPSAKPLPLVHTRWTYSDCIDNSMEENWKCVHVMNDIATKAFAKYGHGVLDSAPVMSLRVDAHPCSNSKMRTSDPNFEESQADCNHFCTPGPPDVMLAAIEAEILARETEHIS
jgi:GDSL/SGNH-like Acyl-Esterase family found in Pmr5 and Cas1p